jgi:hypothetical protein
MWVAERPIIKTVAEGLAYDMKASINDNASILLGLMCEKSVEQSRLHVAFKA